MSEQIVKAGKSTVSLLQVSGKWEVHKVQDNTAARLVTTRSQDEAKFHFNSAVQLAQEFDS